MTRFYKYIFPVIWFGALALIASTGIARGAIGKAPAFLLMPCLMTVIGVLVFRRLIWNLADEVRDGGDFLLVKFRGYQERIPLTNIMNVSASTSMNPPRITLRLIRPGPFGPEIAFLPTRPFSYNPFARNPVADDLIVRVHDAQSRRAS